MAYVYRHIRIDKNIPFYIGIGSDSEGKYTRANYAVRKNKFWNNIIKKTSYYVEIIMDDLSWEEACIKEIEFISLYKRRHEGGHLCNLTEGGEGVIGYIYTEEDLEKIRGSKKRIPVSKYDLDGRFIKKYNSITEASEENSIPISSISSCFKETRRVGGGYFWRMYNGDDSDLYNPSIYSFTYPINQYDTKGVFVKRYNSIADASKELKIDPSSISANCNRKLRITKGFIFRRVTDGDSNLSMSEIKPTERSAIVYQYNLSGDFICKYSSLKEAVNMTGISRSGIHNCITGKNNSVYGFVFKYENGKILSTPNGESAANIPVIMMSIKGEYIKDYKSASEAGRDNNLDVSSIIKAAKGKYIHCGGYMWAYKK